MVGLAATLAVLAGFVDAVGFLSFGHVFIASPDAGSTVFGVRLAGSMSLPLIASLVVGGFLGGVVIVTLLTFRTTQFRRTVVLLLTTLMLVGAHAAFACAIPYVPAILLAIAMGAAHCIFERDSPALRDAMSPSAQLARLGEVLARGRVGANHRRIGLHASFWLAFLFGGFCGAGAWLALSAEALAVASAFSFMLALRTCMIERNLLPDREGA